MTLTKKITSLLLLFALFFGSSVFAQPEKQPEKKVSDQEIKKFASAVQEVEVVNQKTQQKMVATVEEEGLDVQRFNEILQSQQGQDQEADVNNDEMKKFQNASLKLEEIQAEAQKTMQEKIIDEGLTITRYQEIAAIVQNDPVLQQKLQEYLQQES